MKILVTGGAGFIGSHLCKKLNSLGYTVISLDNYFTGSRDNMTPGVEYREGHTKDVGKLVPEHIDFIYHLGEYSRVEKSFSEPEKVWDLNIAGSFGVLEFWRARKCKLLYAGSSTKFADGGNGKDQSPYAWTKSTNTELVRNYAAWYNLPYAITYFYNVYGSGERAGDYGTVIEIFRQQYLRRIPLTVVSPGIQQRIFTHVDDIVEGLIRVGEQGEGDGFELGAQKSYSILEIAKLFNSEIAMLPPRAGNRTIPHVNMAKSHALGWKATHGIEDYIQNILNSTK